MIEFKNTRHPILPLYVHIPDPEAHMMPDGRLFIYGSYDNFSSVYCSPDYYPVATDDLTRWMIFDQAL